MRVSQRFEFSRFNLFFLSFIYQSNVKMSWIVLLAVGCVDYGTPLDPKPCSRCQWKWRFLSPISITDKGSKASRSINLKTRAVEMEKFSAPIYPNPKTFCLWRTAMNIKCGSLILLLNQNCDFRIYIQKWA